MDKEQLAAALHKEQQRSDERTRLCVAAGQAFDTTVEAFRNKELNKITSEQLADIVKAAKQVTDATEASSLPSLLKNLRKHAEVLYG